MASLSKLRKSVVDTLKILGIDKVVVTEKNPGTRGFPEGCTEVVNLAWPGYTLVIYFGRVNGNIFAWRMSGKEIPQAIPVDSDFGGPTQVDDLKEAVTSSVMLITFSALKVEADGLDAALSRLYLTTTQFRLYLQTV